MKEQDIILEKCYNAEPSSIEEKEFLEMIKEKLNERYGTSIYLCRFLRNKDVFARNRLYKIIAFSNNPYADPEKMRIGWYGADYHLFLEQLIDNSEFGKTHPYKDTQFLLESFEHLAIRICHRDITDEEKAEFKKMFFNDKTMDHFSNDSLFVVYNNESLLEQAKENGDVDKIVFAYYDLVKKHDKYNVITAENLEYKIVSKEDIDKEGGYFGYNMNVWGG